jgi:hypothetical protein
MHDERADKGHQCRIDDMYLSRTFRVIGWILRCQAGLRSRSIGDVNYTPFSVVTKVAAEA